MHDYGRRLRRAGNATRREVVLGDTITDDRTLETCKRFAISAEAPSGVGFVGRRDCGRVGFQLNSGRMSGTVGGKALGPG